MIDSQVDELINKESVSQPPPEWFSDYVDNLKKSKTDLLDEIKKLSAMSLNQVESRIGGKLDDLPYEYIKTLFIEGSDNEEVADSLRKARNRYLLNNPKEQLARGASEGVISNDGRFISLEEWNSATESEKRAIMVGSTCFHYNSGTPGMDSEPSDRW
jgi:hypothetical protein